MTNHNNVGTGSGVGGGGVSGGGGGVPADSPNFTTQWSLNADAVWRYEAASTIGIHTTASDAHSSGQGLIEHAYTYYTDAANYERWTLSNGYGGGGFFLGHQTAGAYGGNTRSMILAPSDWLVLGGGSGFLPANDGSMSLGSGSGYGWKALYLAAEAEPATPTGNAKFVLFVDVADGKLKVKGASGTVTTLANP